ncbi:MAG: glycosyltransferase [Pseudanabaena sp. M135S2SP2A07QC]|uniref:glycosyltransferase family 2 protein n=1 Tax=Microcystis sp. M074S1 TaxID=2771126 RepID=UPI002583133F|nr:glycosyltransferase [Microcystis sp. M074S1]MCA6527165.1 glycosyltransferase [Pseudanabaena sp. M179S2SP2A07QC]MCA6528861.1 glycosyltransferase [Pseudanabaena sp. M125S2SP2A07QC]MCA6533390.1 glycosyltransferase [Pseudanabaena sp. M176S2SP2A07QC]MCA6539270.1 glycosyltransferase [Pseudanabaena sp. M037S2SP2A07QC]MCA6548139.1 glycosyltransferase [Pseudanabaena sp. M152S2SP2A07QC]MCA6551228.1 glycosyltransferase [Pseudanabaena sp. M135S2SP2A07QC]MCA6558288.1 glycosyltransferase [Pseudanabaena
MDSLVTVIIPAYNRARVIKSSIDSVLNQTYQNFEIIVVNDGSKDNTSDVIIEILQKDSRITYLEHSTNLGSQKARNTGIKASKGEWITFLDSDDQLLLDSLEKRLKLAIEQKVNVVHSECYVIHNDNQLKLFGVPPFHGNIYKQLLTSPAPVFPSLFISKEAIEKINYLDESIIAYQEWDTSIRLAKFYPFGFVPEPTFTYDCRGQDTISKNLLRGANGYKQVIDKHWKDIIKYAGVGTISRHYSTLSKQYKNVDKRKTIVYRLVSYFYLPNFILDAVNVTKKLLKKLIKSNK